MSQGTSLTKDTRAIMIAIAMATIAIIGINKTDISELRTDVRMEIRELRGLLIAHISGHNHVIQDIVVSESSDKE